MHFLWGSAAEAPLRYRLLPAASFYGSISNYEARQAAGLPLDPVLMHCGGLHGKDKQAAYERLGLFHGEFNGTGKAAAAVKAAASAAMAEAAAAATAAAGRPRPAGTAAGLLLLGLGVCAAGVALLYCAAMRWKRAPAGKA